MKYWETFAAVQSSTPDEWSQVEHWPMPADGIDEHGHHALYIYNLNVAVSLAFGAQYRNGESWTEKWSTSGGFPDHKIYGCYLDIRYHGVVLHRDLLLLVDGFRGILPAGAPIYEGGPGEVTGMRATEPEITRARLLDGLHGHDNFDRYARSAGLIVD